MTEQVGGKGNETRDEHSGTGMPSPLQRKIEGEVAEAPSRAPLSADLHLDHRCNYRCDFCYFTESGHLASVQAGSQPTLDREGYLRLLRLLAEAGVLRLTFAGGEPTLCPFLEDLVLEWHRLQGGVRPVAMVVTNGTGLCESRVRRIQHALGAVKLSGESNSNLVEKALGRGYGAHVQLIADRADMLHRLDIPVHLNSVICSRNWEEDLTPLVRRVNPTIWKIFQVLPVPGQNDAQISNLSISVEQFSDFLSRHRQFEGIWAPEDNELMRGSYAMIDPLGRFFQSTPRGYLRSTHSILDVGVHEALQEIHIDWGKYDRRGGDRRAFAEGGTA
jgi:radical S-adenosyl methionine domain-containing protein 2